MCVLFYFIFYFRWRAQKELVCLGFCRPLLYMFSCREYRQLNVGCTCIPSRMIHAPFGFRVFFEQNARALSSSKTPEWMDYRTYTCTAFLR